MNRLWIACVIAMGCVGPDSNYVDLEGHSRPAPDCGEPDSGMACACPGASVCRGPDWLEARCLQDGTWEKTDVSCVLGLNCRTTMDCAEGEVCCGDPNTGSWGTQIANANCRRGSCSSYTVQLCQSASECVQPDFACNEQDSAYGGGNVSSCHRAN